MINESMKISPRYSVEDWRALTFSTEEEWQKAINIFEDRIRGRFLEPISRIEKYVYTGFAILALDCLLIETLQQFREGKAWTPWNKSKKYFVRFLTETSFSKWFTKEMAKMFYEQIRCGILHQAEVEGSSRVLIRKNIPLASLTEDSRGLVINRKLFHQQLVYEFETYISKLRDPSERELRAKFKEKMDYICRLSEEAKQRKGMSEKILYFAYGSNMNTKRLISRVPSAKCVGRAKLLNKRLVCNKKSKDGSGKANLVDSLGGIVWGVLYEIDSSEINRLDRAEDGYQRATLEVITDQGHSVKAQVYLSSQLTDDPRTYSWYKELMVKGAIEHQLPKSYLDYLEQIPSKGDKWRNFS